MLKYRLDPGGRYDRAAVSTAGRVRQPRHAIRFASGPTPIPQFVPHVGEHTDDVLAAIGRTGDEIAALRAGGVVA